jgi:hypothetical protein
MIVAAELGEIDRARLKTDLTITVMAAVVRGINRFVSVSKLIV